MQRFTCALAAICLLLISCREEAQKVSKLEAVQFSKQLDKQVSDLKIDFIEKNILLQLFMDHVYEDESLRPTATVRQSVVAILEQNSYEKSVYDFIANDGSFSNIKQYEKDGRQHLIYRMFGDGGLSYFDFELGKLKGKTGIADIFIYSNGNSVSSSLAEVLTKTSKKMSETEDERLAGLFKQLDVAIKNADYEKAKRVFEKLPFDLRQTRMLEIRYLQILEKTDPQAQMALLEKMNVKYGQEPSFQLMMIDVHLANENWDASMKSINTLDSVINKDPFLDFYRAIIFHRQGEVQQAVSHFGRVVKAFPNLPGPYLQLTDVYLELKNDAAAKTYFAAFKKLPAADSNVVAQYQIAYPQLR